MKKLLSESDLHNYQNLGVDHILEKPNCGLFLDMGLGKTVTTLTAVNRLKYDLLDISKALVVAPKRVVESVWHVEVDKWGHLNHLKVSRIIGTPKQRLKALNTEADIYLISRDNIAWLCGLFGGAYLPFDMLIIDESSSFKNHKSVRFKALRRVLSTFCRIVILTGTPTPNGLLDLWSQIFILDRGERLGAKISHYRDAFFHCDTYSGFAKYEIRKKAEEQIHEKIADICMSMKAKDYLDLPERIDNFIEIALPPSIQKKYDDFEKEKVLELLESEDEEGEQISVLNAAALSNKLLQFANGAVYDEDKNWHEVHDLKLQEVENIIEDASGKPVLIFRTYKHDLDRLLKKLKKYNPRELKSGEDVKDWNEGKIRVLIMHPASGGHGLNLQYGGNICVWFGQTWSLELYQQALARLDRQGQEQRVIAHHLIAAKTIDQDVIKALERKSTEQEGLMQAIKSRLKKYEKYISKKIKL